MPASAIPRPPSLDAPSLPTCLAMRVKIVHRAQIVRSTTPLQTPPPYPPQEYSRALPDHTDVHTPRNALPSPGLKPPIKTRFIVLRRCQGASPCTPQHQCQCPRSFKTAARDPDATTYRRLCRSHREGHHHLHAGQQHSAALRPRSHSNEAPRSISNSEATAGSCERRKAVETEAKNATKVAHPPAIAMAIRASRFVAIALCSLRDDEKAHAGATPRREHATLTDERPRRL